MAFSRLIQNGLDSAYSAVGDLAETITVAAMAAGSYDFATGLRTAGAASTPVQIRALVQSTSMESNGDSISPTVVMTVPSHRVTVSLDEYTRVTRPDASIYDIVSWSDDGFTTTINMRRATR